MIRWMRSARVAGGKFQQAAEWSREIVKFVKKYEGIPSLNVFMDIFGDSGTIRWIMDYEDLATLEKVQNQIMTDQEYWKKIEQAQGLFIEESIHDIVMRAM